ncbi:MAG: RAMP superfamily CRISPR-associated protein [Candidatus Nitrosocaldaceae archaeon]
MSESNKYYSIRLVLKFRVVKKLHIGNNLAIKTIADLQLNRIGEDIIIPASTVKGVLRSCMIRMAELFNYKIKNNSIYPENMNEDDIITSLLGKPHGYRSKVIIRPVLLKDIQSLILSHVTIDDRLMIAQEGALFKIEYIPPGTEFDVIIEGYNITIDEARLLFIAILEMNYERFGRSGMVEVVIQKEKSSIPQDIQTDKIIKEVLECSR